ncbi:DNA cytosine methyltransferase [Sphingomonas sp.]|uniref:DNA cytosine methyltransferase n=1 Tax=Sphingomonas sp. TaxID=28214 RepID=UPI001ED7805F|nr:DNA cytosine methyltransferase [Sphingomonas sp.]MBX3592927.1 DNA cytosine methyltransferase [Sphingomonas sp.]
MQYGTCRKEHFGNNCQSRAAAIGTYNEHVVIVSHSGGHRLSPSAWRGIETKSGRSKMASNCFVSLFSGAGGLDIGLEMAGWLTDYAADIDPVAVATLRRNAAHKRNGHAFFDGALIEEADVRSLAGDDILSRIGKSRGNIPLLVGGPPCQSWSSAGHQKGFDDPRGQLFNDFVRIAGELDVRWLMFENVRGLLTARGPDGRPGSALEAIRRSLLDAGFQTEVTLVNSADYGVPQRRVRLIVFGYRSGDPFAFPAPSHGRNPEPGLQPWLTLGEALAELSPLQDDEIIRPSGKLAEQLRGIPPGSGVKSPGKAESTRPGGHWGYKQGAFIADPALPARTVTANAQQDWVRDPVLGLRRLSPRECAAIQTFPLDWQFEGRRQDQYRLIGNAVPPLLGRRLGEALSMHQVGAGATGALRTDALTPLSDQLSSAIRYTEREEARNGASRRAAPNRRFARSQWRAAGA